MTESAWRVDEGTSDMLSELFLDDGELVIGDTVHKGRAAIHAWGRHLVLNQAAFFDLGAWG
jgi:hypothetical protein